MNKSSGNEIRPKSHRLFYYIINTDNTHQNLSNFVVDTTFFSNHVMKEKKLVLARISSYSCSRRNLALLQAGTAASIRRNCQFYRDVATSFPGNGYS